MTAVAKLPEKWRAAAQALRDNPSYYVEIRSRGVAAAYDNCADELTAALSPAELGGVELTTSFIQEVPDRCDRIIWRGHYYHLPVNSASTPRAAEAEWLPIESAPKGRAVLVRYLNRLGNERVIKARYIERFTEEASFNCDEGVDEYDEANDRYTYCAGWWEMIDNWDDFAFVAVNEGEPTHWHPIPSTASITPPSAKGE